MDNIINTLKCGNASQFEVEANIHIGTVFLASKLEGKKKPYSLVLLYAGAAKGRERTPFPYHGNIVSEHIGVVVVILFCPVSSYLIC